MNCNHEQVKISEADATYVTGVKGVVTRYRIHTCIECGKVVKRIALSSKPVLSAWGTRSIGSLIDRAELTTNEFDVLNDTSVAHSHSTCHQVEN